MISKLFNQIREHFIHGKIEGSIPAKYPKFINNDPFNLNVRDIDGTQAGSRNKFNKFVSSDNNMRVDDIVKKKKKFVPLEKANPDKI